MAGKLDAAAVLTAMETLPEAYRAPLALYYLEDYPYLEIAKILEIPLGTVQSRIARGKTRLLAMLTGGNTEPQVTEGDTK